MASGETVSNEVCATLLLGYCNKVITVPTSETVLMVTLVMLFLGNRVLALLVVGYSIRFEKRMLALLELVPR